MLTIASFFAKSPFILLQNHMEKVLECIKELPKLFDIMFLADEDKIKNFSNKISKLEHEADLTKNDIRNHLPKGLFMPIDKSTLLNILSLQDSFADKAEDIAGLISLRKFEQLEILQDEFLFFCDKNIQTFYLASDVIKELDNLLESSFGGIEAEKVKDMIEDLAYQEHEIDRLQYKLLKKLYNLKEGDISFFSFQLWIILIREVSAISDIAEKLGNQIRMILELKS